MAKLLYWMSGFTLLILLGFSCVGNLYFYNKINQLESDKTSQINEFEASFKGQLSNEKQRRNKIRDLWESQAVANDKLVIINDSLAQKIDNYLLEIKKTIRFVNTVPQILPNADESKLQNLEKQINAEKIKSEEVINQNSKEKESNKQIIDTIYSDLNEVQTNRAGDLTK